MIVASHCQFLIAVAPPVDEGGDDAAGERTVRTGWPGISGVEVIVPSGRTASMLLPMLEE